MADSFGQRLEKAMDAAGLTQEQLAARLGVSQGTISRWKRGVVTPKNPVIARIAEAVNDPDLVVGLPDFAALVAPPLDAETRGRLNAELRDLRVRYDALRSEIHRHVTEMHTLLANHNAASARVSTTRTQTTSRPKSRR